MLQHDLRIINLSFIFLYVFKCIQKYRNFLVQAYKDWVTPFFLDTLYDSMKPDPTERKLEAAQAGK